VNKNLIKLLALSVLGGCQGCTPDMFGPVEVTITVHVEGVVASAADSSAISGAKVILVIRGTRCVGPPSCCRALRERTGTRKITATDESGRYEVMDTLTYEDRFLAAPKCPVLWLEASAEGYNSEGYPTFIDLECVEETQVIDIFLDPEPPPAPS
jgi:hypothetical protein